MIFLVFVWGLFCGDSKERLINESDRNTTTAAAYLFFWFCSLFLIQLDHISKKQVVTRFFASLLLAPGTPWRTQNSKSSIFSQEVFPSQSTHAAKSGPSFFAGGPVSCRTDVVPPGWDTRIKGGKEEFLLNGRNWKQAAGWVSVQWQCSQELGLYQNLVCGAQSPSGI